MPNLFFASDHHFHHSKIVEGFGDEKLHARPFDTIEDHDEALIVNHNAVVREQDTVWFLGDVFLAGRNKQGFEYELLNRMNGKKNLVVGNHDTAQKIREYAPYFQKIVGYHEIGKSIIVSHIPVHTSQVEERFKANIHGHVHSLTIPDDRYFNVSMENINYTPISLEDIKAQLKVHGIF